MWLWKGGMPQHSRHSHGEDDARAQDANIYFVGPDMDSYRDAIQEVAVHRAAGHGVLFLVKLYEY